MTHASGAVAGESIPSPTGIHPGLTTLARKTSAGRATTANTGETQAAAVQPTAETRATPFRPLVPSVLV
jgi:hypothetical protein